ncbi:MAG: hypothetical protein MUF12_08480 [Sediminibacterium sp.]|jgi:hypothetical protein|nr:hypothetical protein [Sediminibacterium sp.]
MELRISGRSEEQFNENLVSFLNVSTFICLRGTIPKQWDIDKAETGGRWWTKEAHNRRFNILGIVNDNWLNIRKEGENFIVVEFNFRYDRHFEKKKSISNLMLAFFDFVSIENAE